MRRFVCLFIMIVPPLACAGVAEAAVTGVAGKPVCTHYEGAPPKAVTKTAPPVKAPAQAAVAASAPVAPAVSTRTSGDDMSDLRPHDSPRWQSFLPGMFR